MGHLEALAERILFFKGDVEMVAAGPVQKLVDPEAILAKVIAMEEEGIQAYNKAARACEANADAASKQLFERLVGEEESHFSQFEKQRDNIRRFGPSYLALQSFDAAPAATDG
jgi:bacterioferritin